MERYEFIEKLGEGSFGFVYAASDRLTGEVVAIKKIKNVHDLSWTTEVHALSKLKHPNIVNLKQVFQSPAENDVSLVFEYLDCSLFQLMDLRRIIRLPFSEEEIRSVCFQVFQGLEFMHDGHGFMHRDLKPDNLLVSQAGNIKISDLGSAREMKRGPPFADYVTTRWYRSPEMLLKSFSYDEKVDMWAMGAIMAEMFLMRPLFPGTSWEDQLLQISHVIGPPTTHTWWKGTLLADKIKFEFPRQSGLGLRAVMQPWASDCAIDLIESLLSWKPSKRPTAAQALRHPFFTRSTSTSLQSRSSCSSGSNASSNYTRSTIDRSI